MMKCQDIRTAIDTMSKRAPMSHEMKAHVGVCVDCGRYADQTTALLSLLSAQPRVEAPSDFDFRLRARIARAQAEPRGLAARIQSFWSFSWGQAATAAATLALAVTLTTLYVDRTEEIIAPAQEMAQVSEAQVATNIETAVPETAVESRAVEIPKAAARSIVRSAPPVERAKPALSDVANTGHETMRVYNRERGQIIAASSRTTLIGAEAPASGLTRNAAFVPSI